MCFLWGTDCICVFRMVITINSDCFPKQLNRLRFVVETICFLWGTNWVAVWLHDYWPRQQLAMSGKLHTPGVCPQRESARCPLHGLGWCQVSDRMLWRRERSLPEIKLRASHWDMNTYLFWQIVSHLCFHDTISRLGYELDDGGIGAQYQPKAMDSSPQRPDRRWGPFSLLYNE
jgi:hypothetical protein